MSFASVGDKVQLNDRFWGYEDEEDVPKIGDEVVIKSVVGGEFYFEWNGETLFIYEYEFDVHERTQLLARIKELEERVVELEAENINIRTSATEQIYRLNQAIVDLEKGDAAVAGFWNQSLL